MTSGASKDHGPCAGWLDLQLQLCQFSVTGEAPVKLVKREGSLSNSRICPSRCQLAALALPRGLHAGRCCRDLPETGQGCLKRTAEVKECLVQAVPAGPLLDDAAHWPLGTSFVKLYSLRPALSYVNVQGTGCRLHSLWPLLQHSKSSAMLSSQQAAHAFTSWSACA